MPAQRCLIAAMTLGFWIAGGAQSGTTAQTFQEQGPAPIAAADGISGLALVPNRSAASGAIGPVAVDPANSSNIWIGSVNGGVWGSTDGGTSWKPLTDKLPSLSIGALAIDPSSPVTNRTLVAGFGNFSNAASTGGSLAGLAMSSNGGANWQPIGGDTLVGHQISGLAVSGGTILAAASDPAGGLWRSTGGGNFNRVGTIVGPVTSLAADPGNPLVYYAAAVPTGAGNNATVWFTTNAGATWDPKFSVGQSGGVINGTEGTATQLLRVAAGPNGSVAVGVANTTSAGVAAAGVFLYDAAANTWRSLTMPAVPVSPSDPSKTFGINTGGQALTDFAVAIDPRNPKIVYVAGDAQALPPFDVVKNEQPPNGIGSTGFFATVFRLQLADNGTSTATALTNSFAAAGTAPHADARVITFDASGNLLFSADGGLYVRSQPQSSAGGWNGVNTGLQLLEAYRASYDPVTGAILAAAQDNGTPVQSVRGNLEWSAFSSGDGFNIAVNSTSLPGKSVLYFGTNNLSVERNIGSGPGQITRSGDLNFKVGGTDLKTYENPKKDLPLEAQFELNRADPSRLAVGTNRVYVGTDPLNQNVGRDGNIPIALTDLYQPPEKTSEVAALAYGTRDNAGALLALYAGSTKPVVVSLAATPAPGTLQPAAGWPGVATTPVAAVFDPREAKRFYTVDIANIYGTANGGASFQNLRGNLPVSFINLRAVEFLSNNGVNALFVGGQDSSWTPGPPLYVAEANSLTQWNGFGNGLPNAIIDNLAYSAHGDVLVVATLGRGVFSLYDVTSFFPSATVLNFGAANNDSIPIARQLTDGIDDAGKAFSRGLVKNGVGVLTLTVPATYTGATGVNAGTMRAAAAGVFPPTSAFTVATVGVLDLDGYTQTIGSLAGAGLVNLGAGSLVTGGNGQATVFSGTVAGLGGLIKQGSGIFTFSGLGAFTGQTTVAAGTLDLASSAGLSGSVVVQPGAALNYAGAIGGALVSGGNVTLAASGTRVPLGGGLSLLSTSTLSVPVTGGGSTGAVAGGIGVGGTATLGGVMQLAHIAGSPTIADAAPIVATGGVAGRFVAVTGEVPGARFALDYQSDSVVLVPLQNGFVDLARTGNEHAVAAALDAFTDPPNPLVDILSAQPIGSVAGGLASLSGAAYTAFEANALSATRSFQTAIAAHMIRAGQDMGSDATAAGAVALSVQTASAGDRSGFGGLLAAAGTTAADATGTSSALEVRVRPWVETYGRSYELNSANGAPGTHATGGTAMIGADVRLDGSLDRSADGRSGLGAAMAYDFADVGAASLSATQQQAYRISGYGWSTLGGAWLGGSLDYAHVTTQATRQVGFGSDLGQSRASPSGDAVSGQIVLARAFAVAGLRLMPQAAVQGLHYSQTGFTEAGTTGAELAVASRSRDALRSVIGVSAARSYMVGTGIELTPRASLGWSHEFLDPTPRLDASFASGGGFFAVSGATPGRDALLAGVALSAQIGRAALYISYGVSLAAQETTQTATAGLRAVW